MNMRKLVWFPNRLYNTDENLYWYKKKKRNNKKICNVKQVSMKSGADLEINTYESLFYITECQ